MALIELSISAILLPYSIQISVYRPYSRRPVAVGIFCRICPRSYCPIKTGFLNKNDWFLTVFLKTESQRNYRDKCINYFRTVY